MSTAATFAAVGVTLYAGLYGAVPHRLPWELDERRLETARLPEPDEMTAVLSVGWWQPSLFAGVGV